MHILSPSASRISCPPSQRLHARYDGEDEGHIDDDLSGEEGDGGASKQRLASEGHLASEAHATSHCTKFLLPQPR